MQESWSSFIPSKKSFISNIQNQIRRESKIVASLPLATISGSLRTFWQNEKDKYPQLPPGRGIRVATSGPAPLPCVKGKGYLQIPAERNHSRLSWVEKAGSITVTSTPRKIAVTLSPSKKMLCFKSRKVVLNGSSPTVRMRILGKRVHLHIRLLPLGKPYFMATLG